MNIEDPLSGYTSKDIYLRKDGQIIGLHSIGEDNVTYKRHNLDGTVEIVTGFLAMESWGNEYDENHKMLGRGSFRVFSSIEEAAKEMVADGWEIYEGPKPKV